METDAAGDWKNDQWVEVNGFLKGAKAEEKKDFFILPAEEVIPIEAPDDP